MGIEETLTQKFGPLAAWQWGILAGGGMFIARKYLSSVKTPGVTSVTLTPSNGPGTAAATTTASDVGGALGSLSTFLNAIPTQAGTFSFTLPDGTTVTWDNGVPKFTPPVVTPPVVTPPVVTPPVVTPPVVPNPLPSGRGGGPIVPGVTPNPLPNGRGGPVIPGVTPARSPFGGPGPLFHLPADWIGGPVPKGTPPPAPPSPPGRGGPVVHVVPPPLPFLGR